MIVGNVEDGVLGVWGLGMLDWWTWVKMRVEA